MAHAPMPDVLGQPLDRALRALGEAGWEVRTVETAPPGAPPAGPRRVVRQRRLSGRVVELAAAAQIERPPP